MYNIYYNDKKTWAGDQNDNPHTPKIIILCIIKMFIFFIIMLYVTY